MGLSATCTSGAATARVGRDLTPAPAVPAKASPTHAGGPSSPRARERPAGARPRKRGCSRGGAGGDTKQRRPGAATLRVKASTSELPRPTPPRPLDTPLASPPRPPLAGPRAPLARGGPGHGLPSGQRRGRKGAGEERAGVRSRQSRTSRPYTRTAGALKFSFYVWDRVAP